MQDAKITGSWLIHHTNKLQNVTSQNGYENVFFAGKAGILLSAMSSTEEIRISKEKLKILAKASNINERFELPELIKALKERNLIDEGVNEIAVLGITTSSALAHTANIFDSSAPNPNEKAVIELAEYASQRPLTPEEAQNSLLIDKTFSEESIKIALDDSQKIGFVDTEILGNGELLLFNGNLFRRDTISKIKKVIESLNPSESQLVNDLAMELKQKACIPVDEVIKRLGEQLFSKVSSIGLFDVSFVSNSRENVGFVTLPSAFSKYSNSMIEDAFDLAKALVSSITYGMLKSNYCRGQIVAAERLLSVLINGDLVGPVQAIAEDYKLLELKGVVRVEHGSKKGRSGPMLKLLKKDIGELALQAIKDGDVSEHSLHLFPSAALTKFIGPEESREIHRRKQRAMNPKVTNDMIDILRTGGGF